MGLFHKTKSIIGVDIGTHSVKIVELKREQGHPTLQTFGIAEQSIDIVRDTSPESTKKITEIIKHTLSESQVTSKSVIAALPTFSVFSSILSLPAMPKKDLAQAVRWEAKKFVPMPLDEMILDWKLLKSIPKNTSTVQEQSMIPAVHSLKHPVGTTPPPATKAAATKASSTSSEQIDTEHLRVLITAAPKSLVSRYVEIFKNLGMTLVSLETEAFGLARSLIGSQHGSIMIVDVGSITTDIVIIEDGIPLLNRSIDVGGTALTTAIAQGLHIDTNRAEQFKRDIGINQAERSAIPRVMEQTMRPIVQEITYSHNLYQSQTDQSVDKIILTGGSALLPAIDVYLSDVTNINAYLGDPWSRVRYLEELKPVLDEVGTRLAVAVGLALRPLE